MEKIKFLNTVESTYIKGDVVITDPCYLDHMMEHEESWITFINKNKIPSLVQASTLYGDWGCTLFNVTDKSKNPEPIGKFTSDAGMVCCCTLEDVLKFNPKFQSFIDNLHWCVSVIKNFEGYVYFDKFKVEYTFERKSCTDYILKVRGFGKKDGKDFRFCSEQTSL